MTSTTRKVPLSTYQSKCPLHSALWSHLDKAYMKLVVSKITSNSEAIGLTHFSPYLQVKSVYAEGFCD